VEVEILTIGSICTHNEHLPIPFTIRQFRELAQEG